jgi:twinkle protein
MGKIIKKNQPCLDQIECKSSDARQIYEDGTSFCFSCKHPFKTESTKDISTIDEKLKEIDDSTKSDSDEKIEEINKLLSRGFKERGITKVVSEFFDVKVSYNEDGEISHHYYPYFNSNKTIAGYKVRKLPKTFWAVGNIKLLFGMNKFSATGKRLVIVEGELDALSIAQAFMDHYKRIYPVVSIPSASLVDTILDNREWIRSFDEVVLWFDNDKAGEEALNRALRIVGYDKAKVISPVDECKDASDVLIKKGFEVVMKIIWDAQSWSPVDIVTKEDLWKRLCEYADRESIPYPDCISGLNDKIQGMRLGEISLFISGTGSGKSTMLREIDFQLLKHLRENNTKEKPNNDKIGVITLEESPEEYARKMAGMALNINPANEEIPLEDLKQGFDQVFDDDRFVILDHQCSITDDSLIDRLEYMCLMGCKYIKIDHITILVSEGSEGLTGNEAIDKVMNDLLKIVKRYNVWIGLISHLRKSPNTGKSFEEGRMPCLDDIKGSGSIKQISFDIIGFARNSSAADENERNKISISVLKARTCGLTGPVKPAFYDIKTGRLKKLPNFDDFEQELTEVVVKEEEKPKEVKIEQKEVIVEEKEVIKNKNEISEDLVKHAQTNIKLKLPPPSIKIVRKGVDNFE